MIEPIGQVSVEANGEWILKGWTTKLPEGVHCVYGKDPLRDIVFRYIDRMNDVAPECGDPADRILGEFARDVNKILKAERAQKTR